MKRSFIQLSHLPIFTVTSILFISFIFYSYSGGITGMTKKNGDGCTCHGSTSTSGVNVTITGPSQVVVNTSENYTLTITGGPAVRGGTNIAALLGSLTAGTGLQKIGDELTHTSPRTFSGGSVSFTFSYTAPSSPGSDTIFANGNSVNFNGGNDGDAWNFAVNKPINIITSLGSVTVNSPNGGETWYAGQVRNITWSSANITNVKIELSTNNGSSWNTVTANTPASTGSYSWTIPNSASAQSKIKISDVSNSIITDESNAVFTIASQLCKDVNVTTGWNIIAVPVTAANMSKTGLFPTSASPAYAYANGYVTSDTLSHGRGYWLKFSAGQNISICGTPVILNSVPVVSGWNLISVYENDVQVSQITSSPSGIITSPFYGYSSGYTTPTVLSQGKGYWVKVSQSGNLILPIGLGKQIQASTMKVDFDKFAKLIISDADRNQFMLYTSNALIDEKSFLLPPVPPTGIFDARFANDRFVESILSGSQKISVNTFAYPISIKTEGQQIRIKDVINGEIIDAVLRDGESIEIHNNQLSQFIIESIETPAKFELIQNFPNPFNPETNIRYEIPTASHVELSVYNILGEKVATLVDEFKEAGIYQSTFSGKDLPSGVYVYRLQTINGVVSKSMSFIK
ncbi:MAG: T9SS type A sorting domain-containing protein [Ignavibacteria bacterium]|nr:T9SS type A sorting domain-containing protein [Ignavibacteria bacterium]